MHKLGVDVQIALMRHYFMDENQLMITGVGDHWLGDGGADNKRIQEFGAPPSGPG